jgi:hypothetical protein
VISDHEAELQRRVYEDAATFHEVRGLWRIMQDHAGLFTTPDERTDLTRVSQRVYGRRGETLTVQAAAGLDSPELEMSERLLVLPTAAQLREMKLRAGYAPNEV